MATIVPGRETCPIMRSRKRGQFAKCQFNNINQIISWQENRAWIYWSDRAFKSVWAVALDWSIWCKLPSTCLHLWSSSWRTPNECLVCPFPKSTSLRAKHGLRANANRWPPLPRCIPKSIRGRWATSLSDQWVHPTICEGLQRPCF